MNKEAAIILWHILVSIPSAGLVITGMLMIRDLKENLDDFVTGILIIILGTAFFTWNFLFY